MTNIGFVDRLLFGRARLSPNQGAALILALAIVMASAMGVLVKILGQTYAPVQIVFVRAVCMLALLIPILPTLSRESFRLTRPGLVAVRSVFQFGGQVFAVLALIHLPLAEAQALSFSKSFILAPAALLIFGETVTWRRWLAIVIGFVGVLIILQPADGVDWAGLYAIASAASFSVSVMIAKVLLRNHSPQALMAYGAGLQALLAFAPVLFVWRTPTGEDAFLFLAMGLVALFVQPMSLTAFRIGDVSALAPIDYTRLLTSALAGFLVFSERPGLEVWIGAAVIIAANLQQLWEPKADRRKPIVDQAGEPHHDVHPPKPSQ